MEPTAEQRALALLYDRGEGFFAQDELAGAVGVSPVRLDDLLRALELKGHAFETDPAHGVRLVRPTVPDAHLIERGLPARRVGRHAICFREVDSTNDVARDCARQAGADGLVVLAEHQRRGRGRHGRKWLSAPSANVLMSVLLIDGREGFCREALTIAAGLAVAEGVENACSLACSLKWPNDVLLEGAKVAGVLVEVSHGGEREATVVGIGINCAACPADEEMDAPATHLERHLGHPVERVELVRAVLSRLDAWVCDIAAGRLDALHEQWLGRCGMVNHRVEVISAGKRHVGLLLDVSPLEGLHLACDDGWRVHLPAESSTIVSWRE